MLFKLFNINYSNFTLQTLTHYPLFFTRQSIQTYTSEDVIKNGKDLFPYLNPHHYQIFQNKFTTLKHIPSGCNVIVSNFKSIFYPSRSVVQLNLIHDSHPFLNTYIYIIIEDDLSIALDFSYPFLGLMNPNIPDTYFCTTKSSACHFYSFTNKSNHDFHAIFNFPNYSYKIAPFSKDPSLKSQGLLDSAPWRI